MLSCLYSGFPPLRQVDLECSLRRVLIRGELDHSRHIAWIFTNGRRVDPLSEQFLAEHLDQLACFEGSPPGFTSKAHFQGYAARLNFLLLIAPTRLTSSVASRRWRSLASGQRAEINFGAANRPSPALWPEGQAHGGCRASRSGTATNLAAWARFARLGFEAEPRPRQNHQGRAAGLLCRHYFVLYRVERAGLQLAKHLDSAARAGWGNAGPGPLARA